MNIVELRTEQEYLEAYPVMHELREHLSRSDYVELITRLARTGYRLFAVRTNDRIVALAGLSIATNFAYGKHMWVYDMITVSSERSKGFGSALLTHIEKLARREDCNLIAFSSAAWCEEEHRFYEDQMEYERTGLVFSKALVSQRVQP
jgi:GNAT superfamily N-acetyltransferase